MARHKPMKPWSATERAARHSIFSGASQPRIPPAVLADRDRRAGLRPTLTQLILGDPLPGRSALDLRSLRDGGRFPS